MIWIAIGSIFFQQSCASCHEDVSELEVPGSVHFEAAIRCVSCHGEETAAFNPAAANPHSAEFRTRTRRQNLPTFCGSCHSLDLDAFTRSLHHHETISEESGFRGCLECHSAHGTSRADLNSIWSRCQSCHDPGSDENESGRDYQRAIAGITTETRRLEDALKEARQIPGVLQLEEREVLQRALMTRKEMRVGQHSLALTQWGGVAAEAADQAKSSYDLLERRRKDVGRRLSATAVFLMMVGAAVWSIAVRGRLK